MDITNESLKSMKAKQLRRLIREAVIEVLNEETFAGKNAVADLKADAGYASLSADAKSNAEKELQKGGSVTLEGDLDEMARLAKGFRLADPNVDASQFTKSISGTPLSAVIDYFRENPGADKKSLQSQFNFVRPQIANAIVNGLLDAGVLVKLSASGEEEAPAAPGEERPETIDGPEAMFIGSGDPLAQYFDNVPNNDGEEDFNAEEEPTVGDVEPGEPASTGGMSDEDYDAFMKYTELADRLAATKSNLLKMKRKKGGTAGDISDKPSTEEQRLRDLKKSLEDRVNKLVAGSEYLQKRIEKQTGKAYEPVVIEPEETEEEPLDEAFDAEYEKRKLQFYAGIVK